jgi:hypothetical protein
VKDGLGGVKVRMNALHALVFLRPLLTCYSADILLFFCSLFFAPTVLQLDMRYSISSHRLHHGDDQKVSYDRYRNFTIK